MGMDWTSPCPLTDADSSIPKTDGLYRIWHPGETPRLEYVGQSANLRSRLYRHRRNREESLLVSYSTLPEHNALHKREENQRLIRRRLETRRGVRRPGDMAGDFIFEIDMKGCALDRVPDFLNRVRLLSSIR